MASSFCCCYLAVLLALAALASPGRLGAAAEAADEGSGGGAEWHVVSVSSLLPSRTAVCTATTTTAAVAAPNSSSALPVVHRHGPCSPPLLRSRGGGGPPSHAEILARDQERLHAMHRKVSTNKGAANATIQARWGRPLNTSNYFISVRLGTPARDLAVEFDTGSSQSWVQCKPCAGCYPQHDPLFDPAESSTYSAVSCGARECRVFATQSQNCSSSGTNNCRYEFLYSDQSKATGTLARDTLRLTPDTTVPGFMFGCGHDDAGVFGEVDGLFGLGRGEASLSSQAAAVNGGAGFSYCLPSSSSTVGYMTFGAAAATAPANAQFTAMVPGQDESWYYLNLTGIKVGGRAVKAPPSAFAPAEGTIIDSGTAFSRLSPLAYARLRSAFRRAMAKHGYTRAPAPQPFDTCYDLAGHDTVRVPSVTLVFDDGAAVDLDPTGVMYAWDEAYQVACLAFAPNPDETTLGVLGNVQQRRLAVVYDVANRKVGFAAKGCA